MIKRLYDKPKEEPKTLGGRLKQARLVEGYSQRKLSELSGVSNAHISRIENDLESPSAEVLVKLCRGLNYISADWLLGLQDEEEAWEQTSDRK